MDSNKIEKLKQLSELYKEGILTKEELEIEKQKVLSDNLSDGSPIENKKDLRPLVSNLDNPDISTKKEIKGGSPRKSDNCLTNLTTTRKKIIYLVTILVILIGIGVFFGIYQHHQSIITQQREQARLDSIAEVERLKEIWRQDSIEEVQRQIEIQRQDSIARIKAMKISPEELLQFKTNKYGERYFKIRDHINDYLISKGYTKTKSNTFYAEEGTDGTGPDLKYYNYIYEKDNSTVEFHHEAGYPDAIPYLTIKMPSDKDAKEFIRKCLDMGFEFSYESNGYKSYALSNLRGTIIQKGNEISIDFYP